MVPQDVWTLRHKRVTKSLPATRLVSTGLQTEGRGWYKGHHVRVKVCALLLPAGRNWRGLKCWLWSLIWFTSLLGFFLWKSSVGRDLIWGRQFSFRVSLHLSHIRDKQKTVTPGLPGGAWQRLPGTGVWAECGVRAESGCCTWASQTDLEKKGQGSLQVQQWFPERGSMCVHGSRGHAQKGESEGQAGAGAPAHYWETSFIPFQKENGNHALNSSANSVVFKIFCVYILFLQFEHQIGRWISEEEKVVSKRSAGRISP